MENDAAKGIGGPSGAPDRRQARWMSGLWRQARALVAASVLAPLIGGALLILQASLLASVLHDAIIGRADRVTLLPSILAIGGLIGLRAALAFVSERAGASAAETIKSRLRAALFTRLLDESPAWTAARPSGAIASMIVDQVEALEGFFARFIPALVAAAILPLAFAVVVLPVEPVVGLLFLVTAPLIPVFMALVGWGAEAASRSHVRAMARLSGLFADRLRGIVTLKLFGRAEAEAAHVEAASDELRRRTLGVLKVAFLSSAVLEFFAALGVAGVAVYVGLTYLGLIDFRTTPLTLQAGLFCLLMAPEVYFPLRQLAVHYHDRAAAKAAVAEMAILFDALPDLSEREAPVRPAGDAALVQAISVAVSSLTMKTPDGRHLVFDEAGFSISSGEQVAILGQSGIGKSTLLEALARLRTYEGGIVLGVQDLQDIKEEDLRNRIAFLGQRPRLFQGSIADNIRLGRRDASDEEVRTAAEKAQVLAFADLLDQGLETIIGDGGVGLSGGEAHRVALARIFLRDPALILLDEPTAHLDVETEARVIDAIRVFAKGRTLIVATHSQKVAAVVDRVFHIADGKVVPAKTDMRRSAA
ncbi:thiol reductant ABC exporter subunit CydD [Microvirga terricola]|uniref:Thiol reductant ABC exporter subunit CydD n=1 Tax=Microvirga terricola TaxID=2719797 RepID=A0ABX0VE64_9HYPH|nr:thiol reductant ABC exporter subunit CydD [Microvirga terricola]NIX78115.1 thiol reductant ABC exporter subunit CydD [Microvirga terricola]